MALEGFIQAQRRMLDRFEVRADSRFVDVAAVDGRAHVLVAGEGPPVLLLIGGGPPAAMWAPLMAQLEGFTLHALDLPGFGLSDPARYSTGTLRSLAVEFLEQVLDGLDLERPVLVGHSMGGLWCTWLALDRPERVPAMVYIGCPALMLGSSAPLPIRLTSYPPLGRLLMRLQPPSLEGVDRVAAMAGEDLSDLPELRELMLAHQELPTPGPALLALHHAAVRARGARPEVVLTAEELARLTQPVQLIWGEGDTFGSPAVGRRAAAVIPDAELHVIGGGHGPWLNEAERVGAIAAPFLRRHSAAAIEVRTPG